MTTFNEIMSGGVLLDDSAIITLTIDLFFQDGVLLNSSVIENIDIFENANGGSLANGSAVDNINITENASGGSLANGNALYDLVAFEVGEDGALLDGISLISAVYDTEMNDGVLLDGPLDANHVFTVSQNVNFAVDSILSTSISFVWNVGELPFYWWVIEGYVYPIDDVNCLGITVPEKQNFTQTILARTPKEVEEYFCREDRNWEIVRGRRWSRPADPYLANIQSFQYPQYITNDAATCTQNSEGDAANCLQDIDYKFISFRVSTRAKIYIGFLSEVIFVIPPVVGSGTIKTGGAAETIIKSGAVTPTTASFEYIPTGLKVFTGGSAEAYDSFGKSFTTYVGFTTIIDSEFVFGLGQSLTLAAPTVIIATLCGSCFAFPMTLYVEHNFYDAGVLKNFLQRNGLTYPSILKLLYNGKYDAWYAYQHFVGTSDDNYNQEAWTFSFELQCTNAPFSKEDSSGTPVIKFSILATRKNLGTNYATDTRIVLIFNSNDFCDSVRNFKEDFIFSVNTKTNFVSTRNSIFPLNVILTDKIGMFATQYWYNRPNLNLRISANDVTVKTENKDITPIIPKPPTVTQGVAAFNTATYSY